MGGISITQLWSEYWEHFFRIQLVLVHGLGVLNAIHAALKVRTPQAALGWALASVTFPYFAIPLYWIFGRTKFIGYRRATTDRSGPLQSAAQEATAALHGFAADSGAADGPGRWREWLTTLPATRGNHIELLVDGEATFDAMFAAIDSARDYLLVQFYIVRDDALGMKFQERLIERARAGVKIYFLYDEVGCYSLSRKWLRVLRESGVRVEGFKTTRGWANRFQLNFRNHRKLVIIDGREALTGGLNVGDEYWAVASGLARGATLMSGCADRRCRRRNWLLSRTGIGPRTKCRTCHGHPQPPMRISMRLCLRPARRIKASVVRSHSFAR